MVAVPGKPYGERIVLCTWRTTRQMVARVVQQADELLGFVEIGVERMVVVDVVREDLASIVEYNLEAVLVLGWGIDASVIETLLLALTSAAQRGVWLRGL